MSLTEPEFRGALRHQFSFDGKVYVGLVVGDTVYVDRRGISYVDEDRNVKIDPKLMEKMAHVIRD